MPTPHATTRHDSPTNTRREGMLKITVVVVRRNLKGEGEREREGPPSNVSFSPGHTFIFVFSVRFTTASSKSDFSE